MGTAITEAELRFFVDTIRNYFKVTTQQESDITAAFLDTGNVRGFEFNGIVHFSGSFSGRVVVSMPSLLLRKLLVIQGEKDLGNANLLDTVGEIANTLAGNARKYFGPELEISVPETNQGAKSMGGELSTHPCVINLRFENQPAIIMVDVMREGL